MEKKYGKIWISLFFCFSLMLGMMVPTLRAQASSWHVEWFRWWGGLHTDHGWGIWGDDAGGIYTVGNTGSFGAGSFDMVLIKWNATTGARLWNQMWGGSNSDHGYGIWGDGIGGVYTVGDTSSFGAGFNDMAVVKWNATTGARLWNWTWGGLMPDAGRGIWGDALGAVYTVGFTSNFNVDCYDMVLVKWNATTGAQLWNRTWGGSDYDYGRGVWGDAAGWVYTVGYTWSFGAGDDDILLIKWNASTGTQLWNRTWGGWSTDEGMGIWGDALGALYTVGITGSFGAGCSDLVLVKWNATTGAQLWNDTWGGWNCDYGMYIWGDDAGGIYAGGNTGSFGAGSNDIMLIKWNGTTGTQLWNRTWGGQNGDAGYGIWGDAADGAYVVGYTRSIFSNSDVVLLKWASGILSSIPGFSFNLLLGSIILLVLLICFKRHAIIRVFK